MSQLFIKRDKLFLLKPGFADPAFPEKLFYCWHCALLEGVLASFPELAKSIEVERISWPRPRKEVIAIVGEQNQSLPLLVLSEGTTSKFQTGVSNGLSFCTDMDSILSILNEKYGIPEPHPSLKVNAMAADRTS